MFSWPSSDAVLSQKPSNDWSLGRLASVALPDAIWQGIGLSLRRALYSRSGKTLPGRVLAAEKAHTSLVWSWTRKHVSLVDVHPEHAGLLGCVEGAGIGSIERACAVPGVDVYPSIVVSNASLPMLPCASFFSSHRCALNHMGTLLSLCMHVSCLSCFTVQPRHRLHRRRRRRYCVLIPLYQKPKIRSPAAISRAKSFTSDIHDTGKHAPVVSLVRVLDGIVLLRFIAGEELTEQLEVSGHHT